MASQQRGHSLNREHVRNPERLHVVGQQAIMANQQQQQQQCVGGLGRSQMTQRARRTTQGTMTLDETCKS